jgi:hypothetical protein
VTAMQSSGGATLTGIRRARCTYRLLAAGLLALALLAHPQSAAADADPASDVLLTQSAFYPYQPRVPPTLEATLNNLLSATAHAHMPLKVAIIGMPLDLGAIPEYFGHPQAYAKFLDNELAYPGPEPLLVVMPAGFGLVGIGPASALARIPIDARESTYGLTRAAILAVVALARAHGQAVSLPALPPPPSMASEGLPAAAIAGFTATLVIVLGLVLLRLRARRRSRKRATTRRPVA